MKQILNILAFFLTSISLFGQINYSGFIDKYPIELVTDGEFRAIYSYSNYDEPIVISGELKEGKLMLYEVDINGNNRALLTFENFDTKDKELEGTWTELSTNKQLKISLTKTFEINWGDAIEWSKREILQPASLKERYFKLIISKQKGELSAKVTGVKILEKKTDKLVQQIDLECQLWGLDNISVQDYNFDGIEDFSVFKQSHSGPNTTSLFFLYNPITDKYFDSGFSGTSLEFDTKEKRIYEHNVCCAGTSHMNAEYKIVKNKMVLVKKLCTEYDEKIDDFKTVKCDPK